ncbi:TIGR00725 family protein [Pseudochelatococcus contaminans]|uniref:TIGR00725 family protein n=1 Tax=Pseudochelatococcus contaminans TaxID=1538103 RepID=A0A7W5Z3R5_9HYPH|nr:TIGR00725 family protein [Pseudochelatococcus contaminans]MBB3809429.1 hypothetical protein [Pseudochelatococcus contaminans]
MTVVDAPSSLLAWSGGLGRLFRPVGYASDFDICEQFDPWLLQWRLAKTCPADLAAVSGLSEALRLVFTTVHARRAPVGVIGPRDATDDEYGMAESLGRLLAVHGLQMICGGMGGVMEAACKGHLQAGGAPVGLLPQDEWNSGNPYVAIPIATGIGAARNAIIARASIVLVAVGGGYGTLTEMAYGLHFNRLVLGLGKTPFVAGAVPCASPAEAISRVAGHVLERMNDPPATDQTGITKDR